MSLIARLLTALYLLGATPSVLAAHITDMLVVGMYAEPADGGTPLRLLSSGTPLEVLQQKDRYSEVRLADDTRGWVESTYITEEKPAKAMLLETQARLRQMGIELAALRADQAVEGRAGSGPPAAADSGTPPSAREAQLRQSLEKAETRVVELERQLADRPASEAALQRLETLQARVREAADLLANAEGVATPGAEPASSGLITRYRSWIVGLLTLLLGFGGGVAFVDYRSRKRHGGFRV